MQCTLNGIVEHDVLFGQFQQHGVIKELIDGDILTEALQGEGRGKGYHQGGNVDEQGALAVPTYREDLLQAGINKLATCVECACRL